MQNNFPRRVENYTTPALVMLLVNLLWIFGVIWAQWGFWAVILTAAILNHLITRLHMRRIARDRPGPRRLSG